MKNCYLGISLLLLCLLSLSSQYSPDVPSMKALKASLGNPTSVNWTDPDPCRWSSIKCTDDRVTHIQLSSLNLKGRLPSELKNLSSLTVLDVENNQLTGPIPSLAGLSSLQEVFLSENNFTYISPDFFQGLTSLEYIILDNNQFSSWEIPESLKDATCLIRFSARYTNIFGTIPEFLGEFPQLTILYLSGNNLQGQIPYSFARSSIQNLQLDSQMSESKLNGSLAVLQNMTSLKEVSLDGNHFSGPLPDLSRFSDLEILTLTDNQLTGIVSLSSASNPNLTFVYLANNLLQGPIPKFDDFKVNVGIEVGFNSFCLDDPGAACDCRVNILLSIAESVSYPVDFAQSWKGNDPCDTSQKWIGISCDDQGNITVVSFQDMGLSGTISSNFSRLTSLKRLILSYNSLTGTIPDELTTLPNLELLDVSSNRLYGKVPKFGQNVIIKTEGNPDILPTTPNNNVPVNRSPKNQSREKILGSVIGAVLGVCTIGLVVCLYTLKRKRFDRVKSQNTEVIHPRCESDGNALKISVSDFRWSVNGDEVGNMIIPLQVLRNATNNFREENILGRGGFGTVYKGVLQDGTEIAVKRMESRVVTEHGVEAFKSEIEVLTKVRHRHLLTLLGYSLDENERLLVYEYMPQGTLHRHLFKWEAEGLKPLEWRTRLTIALDVARGVEYLHGLAHQSFIHRDLKPSNILLGDNMHAKIADFGLARLISESIRSSIETRLAGTFGYLAPEYIATGRVTKKIDVYSFGVMLMELVTGRKAVDATNPEDVVHLVTWFRSMHVKNDALRPAIDETIELDEETLNSIISVAELADQCCACEPQQRPAMVYAVRVLSSLAKLWKPTKLIPDGNDLYKTSISNSHSITSESPSPAVTKEEPYRYSIECRFSDFPVNNAIH